MAHAQWFRHPIKGDPSGNLYCRLIELLCARASHAGLVCRPDLRAGPGEAFLAEMESSCRGLAFETLEWPGTRVATGKRVVVFETGLVRERLGSVVPSLYSWLWPDRPEDLFFFDRASGWIPFFSISHESQAYFVTQTEEPASDAEYEVVDGFCYPAYPLTADEYQHLERCAAMVGARIRAG